MQTSLHAIAEAAKRNKTKRFLSLYSLFNREMLERAYWQLNKDAAAGVDQVTFEAYGKDLQENLITLETRLKQKRYWPQYVKRVVIPKPNGKTRPLGMPTLEDKIVQKLGADILMALFEPLFLSCSYAYRQNISAKRAISDLQKALRQKYSWVVEADICSFFDTIDHEKLLTMVEKRVNDRAFIGLMRRILKSGVLHADGSREYPEQGTPQGGIISPVFANIYLHYVLDVWFEEDIKPQFQGEAFLIRYADDFVTAFRFHKDAMSFYRKLGKRLKEYSLQVSESKTRKILFSRFRKEESKTFTFLGFAFRWIRTRRGCDTVSARMSREKIRRVVKEFSLWCEKHRNKRIAVIMGKVRTKLRGIKNYFNFPGYTARIREVYYLFRRTLFRWLNRRSERKSYNWITFTKIWKQFDVESVPDNYVDGIQLSFVNKLL